MICEFAVLCSANLVLIGPHDRAYIQSFIDEMVCPVLGRWS